MNNRSFYACGLTALLTLIRIQKPPKVIEVGDDEYYWKERIQRYVFLNNQNHYLELYDICKANSDRVKISIPLHVIEICQKAVLNQYKVDRPIKYLLILRGSCAQVYEWCGGCI